ncbi:SNF2 family N-terminal domain-containing protein [Trametes meyenii]|nr:SNF2 family N-terminal domain-containing protein [Trametes meyenii]
MVPPRPYVEVPALSQDQKKLYKPVAEDELESEIEFSDEGLDRVVGDVYEGQERWFFVKYEDGIVYKVYARPFEARHLDLVQNYETSKDLGSLPPFNPTSSEVHPGSREAALTVKIPGLQARPRHHLRALDEYSSDELAQDAASDSEVSLVSGKRRSRRAAAVSANKKLGNDLPFSPKKTRSGIHAISVHGTDSDSDVQQIQRPTRKSTRARKTRRTNLDDEDFEDTTFANDTSDVTSTSVRKGKKKVVRGKASRPAYGHFRVVADLLLDEEEDDERAALYAHRGFCEKCQTAPTHEQLKTAAKRGKKRKKEEEEEYEDEETRLNNLGGWVRCLKCPVAAHWGCLAKTQRDEILRAAHERDKADWRSANSSLPEPQRRLGLDPYQTTEFICGACMKGGICMGCKEIALKPDQHDQRAQSSTSLVVGSTSADPDVAIVEADPIPASGANTTDNVADDGGPQELLFRCLTCRRLAHYAHLPVPDDYGDDFSPVDLAYYYQHTTSWKCADCWSFVYQVEHILAWRPYPENAVEPPRAPNEPVNVKVMLPREYLIKWVDRSYRRVEWVPHGWLLAMAQTKLKNFLQGGTKVPLLHEPISEKHIAEAGGESTTFNIAGGDGEVLATGVQDEKETSPLFPNPDAERKIPPSWKTVNRVLDLRIWHPRKASKEKGKARIQSDNDEDERNLDDPAMESARQVAYAHGEEPPFSMMVTVEEFESLTKEKLGVKHASRVAWAFFKWDDLGYDNASWDSPPHPSEASYPAYLTAFKRYLAARSVTVPSRNKNSGIVKRGLSWRKRDRFRMENQPNLGQGPQLKLMPFQVEGVNWLCHNWNISQNCILADEMGLGKTVQIVTFIGYLAKAFECFPALVVVPNSTITNWVREFERWAPNLRVVPFYGESKSREIIKQYELFHPHPASGTTGAKYHVLVTTYETVTNAKEFAPVFKKTPRWEILVVDEGQRLKSDASLIFKRLKELNSFQRVIMTGTPLNNNIRELFNLMNFLDPDEWRDLEALSKQYEELTDELVKDLHVRLKPYFLRRIKSEVLQLPPKNEVIVPVSMAPLQKEIYRSILSQNLEVLRSLAEGTGASKNSNALTKSNMNNMLMQLRKCIQHPYLVSETIEPRGLSPQETHDRLVAASAKLRFLKTLLPKLKARGHRVLLFSQFVIALDVIEDFLLGEGIKYLRLDGNTKQHERQKGMDEFNKPGSDVFIYLLTTRAGGVGINLWSADTVIIFDPDFNPHQVCIPAIARAHRFGQKKTVLVFKLMVKDSAEERIMQTGKKKLVLDHLIVQKMDESGTKEDVQSILMFGAKALFEENEESAAREIHYSEHDIDNLIEKTEKEGDEVEPESGAGSLFAFAKVWSADKEGLEDLPDEAPENLQEADSWAKALQLIATERVKEREKEVTGRGVRRKAAAVFPQQSLDLGDTPTKEQNKPKKGKKSKNKVAGSDDSDFHAALSDGPSESDGTGEVVMEEEDIQMLDVRGPSPQMPLASTHGLKKHKQKRFRNSDASAREPSPNLNRHKGSQREHGEFCGLCGKVHPPGHCSMTDSAENLAQYRLMLMQHAGDETIEERRAAIRVIDETLHRLGKISLIYGQPLHLIETPPQPQPIPIQTAPRVDAQVFRPDSSPAQPAAGPSRNGVIQTVAPPTIPSIAATIPRQTAPITNAVASSSKRPSSPVFTLEAPRAKKAKEAIGKGTCVVCGLPYHLIKSCPVVAQGPLRISEAIQRLSRESVNSSAVNVLRNIMAKQQRQLSIASKATTLPSGPAFDLNGS